MRLSQEDRLQGTANGAVPLARLLQAIPNLLDVPPGGAHADGWIHGLTADSRAVRPGDCFVAIRGTRLDGHAYVDEAIRRGAAAVVVDRPEVSRRLALLEPRLPVALVADSLDRGAFGLSTGLTHIPSGYGDTDEVRALVEVVASRDATYATHARAECGPGFPDVEEAIATCRDTGARLQFSHAAINEPAKWGRAADVVALFERAAADGLDVWFDVYPYDASSSSLTQYLPPWTQAGGTEGMRRTLADPAARQRAERELAAGWMGGIPWYWDRVVISRSGPGREDVVGLSIEEAAARAGVDPVAFTLDLCLEHGNAVQVVLFYRTEADMTTFLAHHRSVVGSDGSAVPLAQNGLKPHPRGFGTYPRVLGRYVREQGVLSLPDAVRKMTGAVADRLRLPDRGRVRVGAFADLVAFDPATVRDVATFTEPAQPPVGISHVVVNGTLVVDDGTQTAARPGRVLRRSVAR